MSEENRHILQMATIYRTYRGDHNGKPASSVAQLKDWALKQPKEKFAKSIKDPLEEVFISPRDKQPYGIVAPPTEQRMGPQGAVVFETVGVRGNHLVGTDVGGINVYDEDTFKKYIKQAQ